ncbi:uncharacterized protein LOC119578991 [Penaeus monodon]|uniref:uncharacterized protein LOC119578991 n=1 Tax=Penaeus monodon TaxID=6687 RepID=UPI0018A7687E|nr:uncharacterized protein LOC119578991 [Penaeus monodon]
MAKLTSARTITSAKTFGPTGGNRNPRLRLLDSGTQRAPSGLRPASSGYPCAPWPARPLPSRVSLVAFSRGPSSSTPQLAIDTEVHFSTNLCSITVLLLCLESFLNPLSVQTFLKFLHFFPVSVQRTSKDSICFTSCPSLQGPLSGSYQALVSVLYLSGCYIIMV